MLRLHRHEIDFLAAFNAILSGFALYPQVFKLTSGVSTEGISQETFWIIFINSSIWLAYALHRSIKPLAVSSTLNAIASAVILYLL